MTDGGEFEPIRQTTYCQHDGSILERGTIAVRMAKSTPLEFDVVYFDCPTHGGRAYPVGVLRLVEALWADASPINYG